jgi:hypothetical protein
MKRFFFVSLFLLVVSAPVYAQDPSVNCYTYIDTKAYNGPTYNFCWSSGAICVQCVFIDMFGGSSCTSDWDICDPVPKQRSPGLKVLLKPLQPEGVRIQMASRRSPRREVTGTASAKRRISKLRSAELL